MLKKIYIFLLAFFFVVSSTIFVSANTSSDELPNYEEIIIIDEITLKDQNDTYYFFDTQEDKDMFLMMLQDTSCQLYGCFPGDPGYPHCNDNTVVRIESVPIKKYNTGLLTQGEDLIENWTYGGKYGATMSVTSGKSINFSYQGLSCSVSTGSSQSFNVPPYKRGNVRYRADFIITVHQNYFILKDGSKVVGNQFKSMKKSWGEFYPVYK